MNKPLNVLILGYGEMGKAMEHLIKGRHPIQIWDKFPQANFKSIKLELAAPKADVVIFCLPVNPHKQVVQLLKDQLKSDCLCVSIAKGIDEEGKIAAQIFAEQLPSEQPYALLYGPMISEEIRKNRYAFAQVGSNNLDDFQTIQNAFRGSRLLLKHSFDLAGISWSVILKNVYAILFGIADELNLGDNFRGYLAVNTLKELDQIVSDMGGIQGTPYNLAGLGDLMTTATSDDSHHHELGRRLARGETEGISGEGVHTLAMVNKYQIFNSSQYPLFHLMQQIIEKPDDVENKIIRYLQNSF